MIIDDLKARKTAEKIGLNIIGILGVIVDAKNEGIIQSVKPILEKIKQTNFRILKSLEAIILAKAGITGQLLTSHRFHASTHPNRRRF